MSNAPREDGPALQRLFGKIDGPGPLASLEPSSGKLQQVIPASIAGLSGIEMGAKRAVETVELAADIPERNEDLDGDEQDANGEEDFGIVNYPKFLHEAGEAAIQIVKNMVDSECAMGNPRNIPEPIMGWYLMTMVYQLCVLEVCGADIDARTEHVKQFVFARGSFKYTGPYADSVRDELSTVIEKRSIPAELATEDRTYGGVLVP